MANTTLDFIIVGAFILLFIGVIALGMLQKGQRKNQIHQFKKRSERQAGRPILVQGTTSSPSLELPSSGEPVAFYSISVTARKWSGTVVNPKGALTINGIPKRSRTEHLEDVRGTMAFERSGDFSVRSAKGTYAVRIEDAFEYFESGISIAKSMVSDEGIVEGAQKSRLDLAMEQQTYESVLALLFGFVNPVHNTASVRMRGNFFGKEERKDYYDPDPIRGLNAGKSNVSIKVSQYVYGRDVPAAIQGMLQRKNGSNGLLREGDEIWVVENYIPLGQPVYVFGTYDGSGGIAFKDQTTQLSISYQDPETQ